MATKTIKAWINGAIQEIEVEDIISPEQPLSVEERVDKLEDKHEVVIADGNFLIGNGTEDMEEITPDEVLEHINGASVTTMTTAEFEALEETNANTLYMLTDAEEEVVSSDAVLYTEQTLTDEQKAQARENIGVNDEISSALYSLDLIKPLSDEDGSLAEDDNTLLAVRNDDIFLPEVTDENNGGVLTVENGKWTVGSIEIPEVPDINYPVTSVNGQTGDVVIDIPSVEGLATETYVNEAISNIPDSLPMPATATVGQFIMVSSIDENGVVTATEAVTLLDAEEVSF